VLVNVNDLTEVSKDDRSKHAQAPKKLVIRGRSIRSQDHPKQYAVTPDKNDTSPFLAVYALTKTSKAALSLPTVTSLPIKKTKPKPSLREIKALDNDLRDVYPEVESHKICIQPKHGLCLSDIQLVRGF
jgi:hypothetical protein